MTAPTPESGLPEQHQSIPPAPHPPQRARRRTVILVIASGVVALAIISGAAFFGLSLANKTVERVASAVKNSPPTKPERYQSNEFGFAVTFPGKPVETDIAMPTHHNRRTVEYFHGGKDYAVNAIPTSQGFDGVDAVDSYLEKVLDAEATALKIDPTGEPQEVELGGTGTALRQEYGGTGPAAITIVVAIRNSELYLVSVRGGTVAEREFFLTSFQYV